MASQIGNMPVETCGKPLSRNYRKNVQLEEGDRKALWRFWFTTDGPSQPPPSLDLIRPAADVLMDNGHFWAGGRTVGALWDTLDFEPVSGDLDIKRPFYKLNETWRVAGEAV